MAFICDICEKEFTQIANLTRGTSTRRQFMATILSLFVNGMAIPLIEKMQRSARKKHSQRKTHHCQSCSRQFYRHDKCLNTRRYASLQSLRKYPEEEENGKQRAKQSRWDDAMTVNTTTQENHVHSGVCTQTSSVPYKRTRVSGAGQLAVVFKRGEQLLEDHKATV